MRSPTATTRDTLFVWLGRCTGGRREVRTVKQSLRVRFCVYNRGGLYLLLVGTVGTTVGSLPSLLLRYKSRA